MGKHANIPVWLEEVLKPAKVAAHFWAQASGELKNNTLEAMAEALWRKRSAILCANEADVAGAASAGQTLERLDRLRLTESRILSMVEGLQLVGSLPQPIGEVLSEVTRTDGLRIEKIRVPIGVLAIIYESRPNVTCDAAGLALKTGNVVVLRGGREALNSNIAIVDALQSGVRAAVCAKDANVAMRGITLITNTDRATVDDLIRARGWIDLAIPRGGEGLISRVVENARVPVIETGVGNCHVYVDKAANLEMSTRIVLNAKLQRPSVCNAAETLLVHSEVAEKWLPSVAKALHAAGASIRGCAQTMRILAQAGMSVEESWIQLATETDYETEYNAPILAVRVVADVSEAISHITHYGTQHSECIVTEEQSVAERFLQEVDAAAVYHNASTRFTDGFEFGFGAEIGISTQKMHARGPMGLPELTTYKYILRGHGQTREDT